MSDGLVSGVLAAIERLEKEALSISAGRFVEGMAGRQVDPDLNRYLDTVADPDVVLRLCRAHRTIVERYRAINQDWLKLYEMIDSGATIPESDWRDKPSLDDLRAQMHEVVHWLAEGLGVSDE